MEQLLQFIETMAIDEKLTWRVNGTHMGEVFEISWNRKYAPMAWSIRRGYEERFEMFSNADFRIALSCGEVDLAHFEKLLSTSILSQAVFAEMVMDQIKQMFGADVVNHSVGESKKFLSSIVDMASALGGNPQGKATKPKEKNIINQAGRAPTIGLKASLLH